MTCNLAGSAGPNPFIFTTQFQNSKKIRLIFFFQVLIHFYSHCTSIKSNSTSSITHAWFQEVKLLVILFLHIFLFRITLEKRKHLAPVIKLNIFLRLRTWECEYPYKEEECDNGKLPFDGKAIDFKSVRVHSNFVGFWAKEHLSFFFSN